MRVLLIDGSNYLHRGHWALIGGQGNKREALATSDGFPTSGIKGMLNIVIADMHVLKPDRLIICYDSNGAPNWRQLEYPAYKKSAARVAQREKAAASGNNVYDQLKPLQGVLKAMGLRQLGVLGEEADDVIGTLAVMFSTAGHEVLISSNDKDFGSLVNKRVKMLEAKTRRVLGIRGINEMFGVKPSKMVEYLMLQGDGVDNIPGVPKCGGKTAAKLLNEYGSLKSILANVESLTPVLRANMKAAKKNFKWTRRLLTIKTDVQHELTVENSDFKKPNYARLERLCNELELKQAHTKIVDLLQGKNKWS